MFTTKREEGQALILIALGAVVMMGFTALAIDGARAFEEKRHAQNAADTAAMAAALAYTQNQNMTTAAQNRSSNNGYSSNVVVTITDTASGECPYNLTGKNIKVEITSSINTTFTRVLGRNTMSSKVTAVSRSCGTYTGPPFNGNAIVSLAPSGTGFDAHGTPDFNITGGGIFVNSSSGSAATCGGAADVTAPGVTTVGGTGLGSCYHGPTPTTGATQYSVTDYSSLFPRPPDCNGVAYPSGGKWYPAGGADGSTVAWSGDMDFAPGVYCVTNSPGPFHGAITGSEVTFFITSSNFSMKFNGGGNLTASAPTSGEYKGILLYLQPVVIGGVLQNTQALDMRGNGSGNVVGTVWAPSASVTMFGNSGTGAFDSQIIGYNIDSGGNADITITYNPNNNTTFSQPYTLSLQE